MVIRQFVLATPTDENQFRSIVLFGRNVASYKFALATALVDLATQGRDVVPLSDLAEPYALAVSRHLKDAPKQVTSGRSKFLEECKRYNDGHIQLDELVRTTTRIGFQNVIDAFHRVGPADVGTRFFLDERSSATPAIAITDAMRDLAHAVGSTTLQETEARWNLVETAWAIGTTTAVVGYDLKTGNLLRPAKRKVITSARPALNGYQKGSCFYCYAPIVIIVGDANLADIDHVFPFALEKNGLTTNLDGVWNLVLTCQTCNRGAQGKFDSTPHPNYVSRLHTRNEYLIGSSHPLRETLIKQTGKTTSARWAFLQDKLTVASKYSAVPWSTRAVGLAAF